MLLWFKITCLYLNINQLKSISHRTRIDVLEMLRDAVLCLFHRAVKSLWVFKVKFWHKRDPIHAFPFFSFHCSRLLRIAAEVYILTSPCVSVCIRTREPTNVFS
jgi:hypothetical protein